MRTTSLPSKISDTPLTPSFGTTIQIFNLITNSKRMMRANKKMNLPFLRGMVIIFCWTTLVQGFSLPQGAFAFGSSPVLRQILSAQFLCSGTRYPIRKSSSSTTTTTAPPFSPRYETSLWSMEDRLKTPCMILDSKHPDLKAAKKPKVWRRTVAAMGRVALMVLPLVIKPSISFASSTPMGTTEAAATLVQPAAAIMGVAALAARPVSLAVELQLTIRLVYAALLGAILGKERSLAKHSAGVRTMALVSMGAAAYTVCSAFGFFHLGGARYDPSRMAANVASGVGFVGAGVITTSSRVAAGPSSGSSTLGQSPNNSGQAANVVHGLTTAATIWLSAAVGVACGVGLYAVATTAALTTISILRLGRVTPKSKAGVPTTTTTSMESTNVLSSPILGSNHPTLAGSNFKQAEPTNLSPATDDNDDDDDDDENDENYAETHDTSIWDEHPQEDEEQDTGDSQGSEEAEDNSILADEYTNYVQRKSASPKTPPPASPVREKYLSKSAREDRYSLRDLEDPMSHPLVQHAWRQSNSTTYDDVQDMTFEELERFVMRHKPSTSFLVDPNEREDDDRPDRFRP